MQILGDGSHPERSETGISDEIENRYVNMREGTPDLKGWPEFGERTERRSWRKMMRMTVKI